MSHEKEFAIFLSNWGLIKRSVKLSDVVDPLIEKGIISVEQWSDLKKAPMTESERMEDFMINFIQKGDSENLNVFRGSLKVNGFPGIAEILEGGPGSVCEKGELQDDTKWKQHSGPQSSTPILGHYNTVRQNDGHTLMEELGNHFAEKMKGIMDERLEKFGEKIEKDLKARFEIQTSDLSEKFESSLKSVLDLSAKLNNKGREYEELLEKNHKLENDLNIKNVEYLETLQTKEKEIAGRDEELLKMTAENKQLQEELKKYMVPKGKQNDQNLRKHILELEKTKLSLQEKLRIAYARIEGLKQANKRLEDACKKLKQEKDQNNLRETTQQKTPTQRNYFDTSQKAAK